MPFAACANVRDERAVTICGLAVRPGAKTGWARGDPCENVRCVAASRLDFLRAEHGLQARRWLMARPGCTC